jgi:DNA-binding PadR family transcriptional regulator
MTVYQSLRRLTESGLVAGTSEKPGRYPERTSYQITPEGRRHFMTLIRTEMGSFMRDTLHSDVGVALGGYLSLEQKGEAVNQRIGELKLRLTEIEEELHNYGQGRRSPFPRWLLLDHERHMLTAEIAWLERFLSFSKIDEDHFGEKRAKLRKKAEA